MTKILWALALLFCSWTTPLPLLAAPEVVIGYANISMQSTPCYKNNPSIRNIAHASLSWHNLSPKKEFALN
jgi:hypothetical protein